MGQSETAALKTILYIESPLKQVYNIGHSDWLFNLNESIMHHRGRVQNVIQKQEKLKSGEHQNRTTVLCIFVADLPFLAAVSFH